MKKKFIATKEEAENKGYLGRQGLPKELCEIIDENPDCYVLNTSSRSNSRIAAVEAGYKKILWYTIGTGTNWDLFDIEIEQISDYWFTAKYPIKSKLDYMNI